MKWILGRAGRDALARLADPRALLAFDFDGTLAPIVGNPHAARLRVRTVQRLKLLGKQHPCAVITGRRGDDVAARLRGVRLEAVIGNHGAELGPVRARDRKLILRGRDVLAHALHATQGVTVEDKGMSLSVHFRHARARALALRRVGAALATLPAGLRMVSGKQVVNVVLAHAPTKASALEALRRRVLAPVALFVGDDVTDEDVFRDADPRRVVTVRVGRSAGSAAQFYVRDQREIDALLARLTHPSQGGAR